MGLVKNRVYSDVHPITSVVQLQDKISEAGKTINPASTAASNENEWRLRERSYIKRWVSI